MTNRPTPPPAPLVDFSGMFDRLLKTLQMILVGVGKLVDVALREEGTFMSYASGNAEMPLQKGVNGTIRWIHNPSAVAAQVVLVDGMESVLLGSAAQPFALAAGAGQYCYIPFKNGLRATVGTGGAYVTISGDTSS